MTTNSLAVTASPYFGLNPNATAAELGEMYRRNALNKRSLANGVTLRIMPLGASIVYGYLSHDHNGFRYGLRNQLIYSGNLVNMVGSVQAGTMVDSDVEGWPGYIIDQVAEKAELTIPQQPNVVLLHVGTNDMTGNIDINNAHNRLSKLIDRLFDAIPGVTVIASTLLPNSNSAAEDRIKIFNANIPGMIETHLAKGRKITLVDFSSSYFSLKDIQDGTHPTDAGYQKMAEVWYQGLLVADALGWITAPANVAGVDDTKFGGGTTCDKVPGNAICGFKAQLGFGYDDGPFQHTATNVGSFTGFTNPSGVTFNNPYSEGVYWADINGDGIDDYVYVAANSNKGLGVALSTGNGNLGPYLFFDFAPSCDREGVLFADMTGDGRYDFCCVAPKGDLSCWQNNPGSDPRSPSWSSMGRVKASEGYPREAVRLADIDGDGRADYLCLDGKGNIWGWRNGANTNVAPSYWYKMKGAASGLPDLAMDGWKFADLNGDHKDDLVWVDKKTGAVSTWINQRGYDVGLGPVWQSMGVTHAGFGKPTNVTFGRFIGSGRADYSIVTPGDGTVYGKVEVSLWRNNGGGGTIVKADGDRYCDMRGTGSDDYIWISAMGEMTVFGNEHTWGTWIHYNVVYNINRPRREIHFADFDGDGKCDILLVDKGSGATTVLKNNYANGKFSFTSLGLVTGSATCTEGYGYDRHDNGVRWNDIDGDGRADFLCMELNGRITGYLNKGIGNMVSQGQIKLAEGRERRNLRLADIDGDGQDDLIWMNMTTGQMIGWKNAGPIPVKGSAFTWTHKGVIANGNIARGSAVELTNLNGLGRADYLSIKPQSNEAFLCLNVCPGGVDEPVPPTLPTAAPPAPTPSGGILLGIGIHEFPPPPPPGGGSGGGSLGDASSCIDLENYQTAHTGHLESDYYEATNATALFREWADKWDRDESNGIFEADFASPWGLEQSWKCQFDDPCTRPDCSRLGNPAMMETAAAYQVLLSMSNFQQTWSAVWNALDDGRNDWVSEQAVLVETFNPDHDIDDLVDILKEVLAGVLGLIILGFSFVNPQTFPAIIPIGALVNLAFTSANSGLEQAVDDMDPIHKLAQIEAPVSTLVNKTKTVVSDVVNGMYVSGKYGDVSLVDVLKDGAFDDYRKIAVLNPTILPNVDQSHLMYQYLVGVTINVAWRLQRTWIMSYPMTQEEFDQTVVVAGDNDSRLKFYYNGKGHYFQAVYPGSDGVALNAPICQDPPGWAEVSDKYGINTHDIIKSSVDGFAKGGFEYSGAPDYNQILQGGDPDQVSEAIQGWASLAGVFNLPVCEIPDSEYSLQEFVNQLVRPAHVPNQYGTSSFCKCLGIVDKNGKKFEDYIDVKNWASGFYNYCAESE
ncbi:hypothetical protein F5884DRAFT_815081 [Xylogone sp. PMI_703]|nr:hypothetical protein F5884DRAFT_815081 [Xylogone sp. PMI_703]